MTFGTVQKRHLLTRWPKCYMHTFPKDVTVVADDGMPIVKCKKNGIDNVHDYIHKHINYSLNRLFSDVTNNLHTWIRVLDRGGNIAKSLFAHVKRDRTTPIEEPTSFPFWMPNDGPLPVRWDAIIANREITRREIYPLFHRAMIQTYVPPPGRRVILDGVPDHMISKAEYDEPGNGPNLLKRVYCNRMMSDREMAQEGRNVQIMQANASEGQIMATAQYVKPLHMRGVLLGKEYEHECTEGDLSIFVYVNRHFFHPGNRVQNDNILLDTNDGDTLMIALLHSRDRIDPATSKFVNRLWVKLRGQSDNRRKYLEKKAAAEKKGVKWVDDVIDGRDIYVNVNRLYIEMDRDPDLCKAQYPVLTAVMLYVLSGTDFFDDYAGDNYALFYFMNWEKCVWDTWCKHAERFSHMIMMFYAQETTFNNPEMLRNVYINEAAFITFIYQCYGTKYAKKVKEAFADREDENGHPVRVTPALLEEYTAKFAAECKRKPKELDEKFNARYKMAVKKKCPPRGILVRYIRLALGNIIYWVNDYRPGGHKMFDPFEKYKGIPYYGITRDPVTKKAVLSPICSLPKPPPLHCVPHLHNHRRSSAPAGEVPRATSAASTSAAAAATPPPAILRRKAPLPGQASAAAPAPSSAPSRPQVDQAERLRKQREIEARGRARPTGLPATAPSNFKKTKT